MSISKRVTYLTPEHTNGSSDAVRTQLNAYWATTDVGPKRSKQPQLLYLAKNSKSLPTTKLTNFALTEERDIDSTRLPTKTVSMRVYGNSSYFKNQTHWRAFVYGGSYQNDTFSALFNTGRSFLDHTFTIEKPFTAKESKDLGGNSRIKTSDVTLEYNFYQREYERMQLLGIDEKVLPNLYALYSLKEGDELTTRNNIFKAHASLGGLLTVNQLNRFTDKASENPLASNSAEYLRSYSLLMKKGPTTIPQKISTAVTAYNNIMLSPSSTSILQYNNKKYMFPMYGEITFTTDKTTQFTQILQDSNLSALFMKDLYGSSVGGITAWKPKTKNFVTHTIVPVEEKTKLGTRRMVNTTAAGEEKTKIWEIQEWYDYFRNYSPSRMNTGVFIGQENQEIDMAMASSHGFYKKMIETIFIGKVRTLVKSQQRRFADILDGDSCYSEELFYKIEKYVGSGEGTPVQTFWLANTNEIDVYNFIDSQVKYGEEYTYKASVYTFVLGSRYRYSNMAATKRVTDDCVEFVKASDEPVAPRVPGHVLVNNIAGTRTAINVPNDQRFMAEVDVTITPHAFLVESSFFMHRSRLIDDPPLAPEIDILPFRTDSRFLKFFMQASSGQQIMQPIIITDADKRLVREIKKAKNLNLEDPIAYTSDDFPTFFEIYRMEEQPREYRDFRGKIRTTVSTDVSAQTPQRASGIAYVDQILSNTKYYYMFRSIDVHNKPGAPSPVYEIEMVNDKGAFYPLIRTYDMNTTPDVTQTKIGRRFIQVIPNIEQALINQEKSGFDQYISAQDVPGKLTYGYADESIWNKKFKIRLTSTKTGKKIDVNLRFKTKRVKTDLEESS